VSSLCLLAGNTATFPGDDYVEEFALFVYDCVFVVYDTRFFELCNAINDGVRSHGRPQAFIKTKADQAVDDLMHEQGLTEAAAIVKVKELVRADFDRRGFGEDAKLFIISVRWWQDKRLAFDEQKLEQFMHFVSGVRASSTALVQPSLWRSAPSTTPSVSNQFDVYYSGVA
jgi:hypothetical protein